MPMLARSLAISLATRAASAANTAWFSSVTRATRASTLASIDARVTASSQSSSKRASTPAQNRSCSLAVLPTWRSRMPARYRSGLDRRLGTSRIKLWLMNLTRRRASTCL